VISFGGTLTKLVPMILRPKKTMFDAVFMPSDSPPSSWQYRMPKAATQLLAKNVSKK
jgi:hypothetical protein